MDKTIMQQNNQYYIVSLDNGIREEEPVTIDVFNSFNDGSKLVQLNKTIFGLYKSNGFNPLYSYLDDYEIIKSDIAELLDIDHEESRRIVTENYNAGIFTNLNYRKEIETRISATSIINDVIGYINNGMINSEDSYIMSSTLRLPNTTKGNAINDPKQIENIINLGLLAIVTDIEHKSGIPIDEKSLKAITKKYIRMILFDYLIGRKYRGLDYYIINPINEYGQSIWKDSYFSPISVCNSIDKDELVGPDEYMLNNRLVNRKVLLDVLFTSYYSEIKKTTTSLNDAYRLYEDALVRIIYNNTSIEKAKELETEIFNNLQEIINKQTLKEMSEGLDSKMNKVERTMATQSLNIKVTTKLDLIQKKYPVNPKEHPELINPVKEEPKEERIKLMVEKNKRAKAGFANPTVLVSTVALVCGIITGIAYVVLSIGS